MTPAQIKEARLTLRLTQAQAAAMLGYGAKARISELEGGTRHPSEAVLRLLRAYLDGYRPGDWPYGTRCAHAGQAFRKSAYAV